MGPQKVSQILSELQQEVAVRRDPVITNITPISLMLHTLAMLQVQGCTAEAETFRESSPAEQL